MLYMPLLYIITYLVLEGKDEFQGSQAAPTAAILIYGIIQALFVSIKGQTPGKRAYEIKIVDEKSGGNISFFRAFVRFYVLLVSIALLFGIYVFYRKDRRGIHDILSGSKVVQA